MVLGFSLDGGSVAVAIVLVPLAAVLGAQALHRRVGPAARIVAAFASIGWVLPIFLACTSALSEPLVGGGWGCGTGKLSLAAACAIAALGGTTAGALVGVGVAKLARARAGEVALRAAATVALTALLGLAAIASTHGARESPATWLDSIPATTVPGNHDVFATAESWDGPATEVHGASFVLQHRVGEGVTTTDLAPPRGRARSCALLVTRGGVEQRINVAYLYEANDACPSVRIRWVEHVADAPGRGSDAFIVERTLSPNGPYYPTGALDGASLEQRTLRPADVTNVGPPRAWLWGVLFAGALALTCFVTSARATSRAPEGVEGNHTGKGWVTLVDAAPRFFPALTEIAPGPVLLRATAATPTYRGDGGVAHDADVLVGSRQALRAERLQARGAWAALALGVALLALVPLVAAASFGLL